MNQRVVVGLVAAFVTLADGSPAVAQRGRGESGAEYGWLSDYRQAKELAAQTGKPIMLVFRCIP